MLKYPDQPLVNSSPGPQDPNKFLCLQSLLNSKSVSVSQVFVPEPAGFWTSQLNAILNTGQVTLEKVEPVLEQEESGTKSLVPLSEQEPSELDSDFWD